LPLKYEPPYSHFAADLLVASAAFFVLVVLQVYGDFLTLMDPQLRNSSLAKNTDAAIPKPAFCNASHEKEKGYGYAAFLSMLT
jgi:hypothetical protein